jgi:hypothetical protein
MSLLDDMLPGGARPPKRSAPKLSLSEFIPSGPPPEPEIFSPPRAVELHMCRTVCRCGESYVSPEGVFVEVTLKKLHVVGFNHYYKEVGQVLVPISAERSVALASVPHRIRTREAHTILCHMCIDRADLYQDLRPQSHHEWEVRRPPLYSQAWLKWQQESAPTKTKLLELIEQIERREARKEDEKFQPGRVERVFNTMMNPPVDPERNLEE